MEELMMKNELLQDKSIKGTLFKGYYKTFMLYSLSSSVTSAFELNLLSEIDKLEKVVVAYRGRKFLNKVEVKAIRRTLVTLNG